MEPENKCKAPLKNGERCDQASKTNNWCELHTKKLAKKYISYKLLEKRLLEKPTTKNEIAYQHSLVLKTIARREYLRQHGFTVEFHDEGHAKRIEMLKAMAENLSKVETQHQTQEEDLPEPVEDPPLLFEKERKQRKKKPEKPLKESLDYSTYDTYVCSLYLELHRRKKLHEDLRTQDSIFYFSMHCVLEEIIREYDVLILGFLQTKFRDKAEPLYNLCKAYVGLFNAVVCCHKKNKSKVIYSTRKYDEDYVPDNLTWQVDVSNYDESKQLPELRLHYRICIEDFLNTTFDADIRNKYIVSRESRSETNRFDYALNFKYCLYLALRGETKIVLCVENNILSETHPYAPPHVIEAIKLYHVCAHIKLGTLLIDHSLVKKVLKSLKHPFDPHYAEVMVYRFQLYNNVGIHIVSNLSSDTRTEFFSRIKV